MRHLFTDASRFNMQNLDEGKGGRRLFRPASLPCSIRPWQAGELLYAKHTERERQIGFFGRMARWNVRCSPMMPPLSWIEALNVGGVRRSSSSSSLPVVRQAYSESSSIVRPFNEIPGLWKNGLANLYTFWKQDGFRNLHRIMVQNFNTFGPIYRYLGGSGWLR